MRLRGHKSAHAICDDCGQLLPAKNRHRLLCFDCESATKADLHRLEAVDEIPAAISNSWDATMERWFG